MADETDSPKFTERRTAPRAKVNLAARWERNRTRRTATVTSISRSGCFMLSGGRLKPNEPVRIHITLPNNELISVIAEVVDFASEIGFAARFTWLEVSDQLRLERFLEYCLADQSG